MSLISMDRSGNLLHESTRQHPKVTSTLSHVPPKSPISDQIPPTLTQPRIHHEQLKLQKDGTEQEMEGNVLFLACSKLLPVDPTLPRNTLSEMKGDAEASPTRTAAETTSRRSPRSTAIVLHLLLLLPGAARTPCARSLARRRKKRRDRSSTDLSSTAAMGEGTRGLPTCAPQRLRWCLVDPELSLSLSLSLSLFLSLP
jgi:hypothetical protein